MNKLPFKNSSTASIGIELELQLINPTTFDLSGCAKAFLKSTKDSAFNKFLKPEITQSMIEINSSSHLSTSALHEELMQIRDYLSTQAKALNIHIAGGGTHPFQIWSNRKIFPSSRYRQLTKVYRHLAKQATVFGQHIHIGCGHGEEAIYLMHALSRYVPHFIAICASSPYLEGIDTGYHSTRATLFNSFPMSGLSPYLPTWQAFCNYYTMMKGLGILESMKDVYWDVRPKPEFGTVEIRVCDTPLTIERAVTVAAYVQSLSLYLLQKKPFDLMPELYYLYGFNRFQASRYGFEGEFIDPLTQLRTTIGEDLIKTLDTIKKYAHDLKNEAYLELVKQLIPQNQTDAAKLRTIMQKSQSLQTVIASACEIWESGHESI